MATHFSLEQPTPARRPKIPAPASRPRKSQHAVDILGARIVSGTLASGQLLPTEAELSRQLRLSRPSLREALHALASKGLVDARTRRGTLVNPRARWNILDDDVLRWLAVAPPDPAFFMNLLEVRMIIEPAAARIAAQRGSSEQILAIESAYRGMAEASPIDMEACCAHDLALHERIIAATGNPLLIRFAAAIRTALLLCVRIASSARESNDYSLPEHFAVVAAIRRRDAPEAEESMRILLAGTARDLAPAYEKFPRGLPPLPRRPAKRPDVRRVR